jgi:alpha-glucosidase
MPSFDCLISGFSNGSFRFRVSSFAKRLAGVIVLFVVTATLPAWAEWKSIGPIAAGQGSVTTLPNGAEIRAGAARIKVTALRDSVIRVRVSPVATAPAAAQAGEAFSWAVVPEARRWSTRVRVNQTANAVDLTTAELKVRIERPSGRVSFLTSRGEVISQEPLAPMYNGKAFQVTKSMPEDEHYFGLGDKAHGLDHRNQAFTMWNTDAFGWQESTDPLYKSIPFFLAMRRGKAYGIYLDNTWRSHFDFGKAARAFSFGAEGGPLDYYFFYGPHPKKVLENFTALIGRTPLPPLWSLGFQQCRYSYYPEARVREIARNFRERRIPADVIYLDIDYQDRNRPFSINRQYFPNFEGMISDLGKQGFKVIAITDLHIAKAPNQNYKPFDEGAAGDHFLKNPDGSIYVGDVWPGDSVFPEFTLASGRAWWGTLYTDFVRMGINGFWNDMNEPAIFERLDKTMPLDVQHRLDPDAAAAYAPYVAMTASRGRSSTAGRSSAAATTNAAPHAAIHNVYGMQNVRATYEGLLKLRPNVRPFVLTRAGFAGAQRYAATWTGDNTSSYNHMRISVPNLLSLGISGYPLVGDDIGGYDRSPTPELLTRWLELGVFNPVYRDHTGKGTLDQEPWVHGPEHEAIRKRYIELRYQLMPYIYTAMEETSRTGIPLMRPLFLEYPQTDSLTTKETEFLFGRDLLVAPKVWDTVDPYEIELPPGEWFDYWTGQRHKGGEKLKVQPALDQVPVYVRGGAIVPHQPIVQNTSELPNGPLTLRVYPGKPDCSGWLYSDDGTTFDYTHGEFLRMSFTCSLSPTGVSVRMDRHQGNFQPWWKQVEIRLYGAERAPREVLVNGQRAADFRHDPATKSVSVTVPAGTAEVRVNY